MEVIWSLGARYCVRQNVDAFVWLWGLFLALASGAFILRRRGSHFESGVLAFFALCTAAVGLVTFYGCSASAPYSMGLGASGVSAVSLTTLTCLGQDASARAIVWTIIVLSCSAALGLVAWGRSRSKSAALRICAYAGALLLFLIAAAAGFGAFFAFSWCSSSRLF